MASSIGLPSGACIFASDSLKFGLAQPRAGKKRQNIPREIRMRFIVVYRFVWMNQQQFALDELERNPSSVTARPHAMVGKITERNLPPLSDQSIQVAPRGLGFRD